MMPYVLFQKNTSCILLEVSDNHFSFFITDGPCPSGYDLKLADIEGGGIERHTTASVEDCSTLCSNNIDCCMFEYSPKQVDCILHKICLPTKQTPHQDFMLCKKSKCVL